MILVIGGRSKIGGTLIAELLDQNQQVRALVRAGEHAAGLPAGAKAVTGDLADEGSLVTAMADIEKVFLLSSPHPDAVRWHRTACDRYLQDSGLPSVIVRPNLFLQNIPESAIPSIDTSGTFYADAGEARISMVDTRDVAAVAAVVLTQPGHAGTSYDVTGPEALSYADAAARLTKAMGRPISYVPVYPMSRSARRSSVSG